MEPMGAGSERRQYSVNGGDFFITCRRTPPRPLRFCVHQQFADVARQAGIDRPDELEKLCKLLTRSWLFFGFLNEPQCQRPREFIGLVPGSDRRQLPSIRTCDDEEG